MDGNGKLLRAVSYCRTSGEGQRDNTSIPTQKDTNKRFIEQEGWKFIRHYVDECKSGSKIAGRDDFQRMMRDAAKGDFDIVVPADITRFSRDGFDIIESARTLAREFSVHVVDTKGNFDSRDSRRTLTNFIHAGVAEDDRLRILTRTINGRISNATNGLPWQKTRPYGREYDREKDVWYINDTGKNFIELLERYMQGESLTSLCKEFGIIHRSKVSYYVANSQLAGTYYASFHQPEIGIEHLKVKVPVMPEVVSPAFLAKVRKRLRFNRTHNRTDAKQYRLTGFLHCGCCGRALSGKTDPKYGYIRYRHHGEGHEYANCDFFSVLGKQIEGPILDYLYGNFLDEPAFNAAVARALPPASKRKAVSRQREQAAKQLEKAKREAQNLVKAIRQGAKVSLLLDSQIELEDRIKSLTERLRNLDAELAEFRDEHEIKQSAMMTRLWLIQEYSQRDWRELSQPEIKRFLLNLFGDSDGDAGIYLRKDDAGRLIAEFKGRLQFHDFLANGRPVSHALKIEGYSMNWWLKNEYDRRIADVNRQYQQELNRISKAKKKLGKPYTAST